MIGFTQKKFCSLKLPQQHARAAELCIKMAPSFSIDESLFQHYLEIAAWLNLPPLEKKLAAIQNRFYFHQIRSGKGLKMPWLYGSDKSDAKPFLPIAIYLDRIRSAHNIGSIIRTTEALRCGYIHTSCGMATKEHSGIQKSAMGTEKIVPIFENARLESLPRPLIVLETVPGAKSIETFIFPKPPFTLALGNEELGCSPNLLERADHFVKIPLYGKKNSLNVAAAYAIAAQFLERRV